MIGTARYEFRMQVRKIALWVTPVVLGVLLIVGQGDAGPLHLADDKDIREVMTRWALLLWLLLPIGAGMVLADRGVRERRLGVEALFDSLPTGHRARLVGKYLGVAAATAAPALALMLVAGAFETVHRGEPFALAWAIVAFALVMLPGLLFIAAFALVCPLVLSAPLFRVLFVGYWFWGNLTYPKIMPTLSGTPLTPVGDYPASWLMGTTALYAGDGSPLRPDATLGWALFSVALLIVGASIPLLVGAGLRARAASSTT